MFETFKISFRLKIAYRTNGIIHSIKGIPIISKILPYSLYSSVGLKAFVNVVSIIIEILSAFIYKFFYVAIFIFLPLTMMNDDGNYGNDAFIHIFLFLSLIGAVINTPLFQPSKDKYYAMFVMRMDAAKFTLSNYFYFLIKTGIAFIPAALLGLMINANLFSLLLIPIFIVSLKCNSTAILLKNDYYNTKKTNKKLWYTVVGTITLILLLAGYGGAYLKYTIPTFVFAIITLGLAVGAVFSLRYMLKYKNYKFLYKQLFSDNGNPLDDQSSGKIIQTSMLKKIEISPNITSSKKGCAYLNDIFVKRHRRILTNSAIRFALAGLAAFLIFTVVILLFPQYKGNINSGILTYLPTFLWIMYFVNRGTVITKSLFMNCDHSLLAYRFYRQPKIVLSLFTARLKSIILINFIPAAVISLGLPILLYISGGTPDPLNYLILFVSIIAMSVFFSIHNLVMYYLLQPYNENFEMKNALYTIIQGVTYYLCFIFMNKEASIFVFGTGITAFCFIYAIIALILAYKLAPKTFKLHQ